MMKFVRFCFCAGLFFNQLAACADTPLNQPANSNTAGAGSEQIKDEKPVPGESKNVLADHQVPKLLLRWDCGDCEHNEKVLPLIEQNYADQAAALGYKVSDSETAELVITAYRQRPPAARIMFGVFAGKDTLATRTTFRGKDFIAKDYSANAFTGMNRLCEVVSQRALKQILVDLKAQ